MSASLIDIRLFVAAYEERSFTAAAERENATQSGVSQHVAKLERLLGVQLFVREKGRIAATPAGDTYYGRCLQVLRAYAAAGASLAAHKGQLSGEISIGLMPTMTRSALTPALARFSAAHPNVAVRVVEAFSGALTRDVRASVFDFAIVPAFSGGAGLRVRPFLTTPETLVSRMTFSNKAGTNKEGAGKQGAGKQGAGKTGSGKAAGPLAKLRHLAPVRLAELGPLKLVLPGPENTRRQTLSTYFATHGVSIARTMELDAMMGTLDYVGASDWTTILPGVMMASDVADGRLKVNPIAGPRLDLDLVSIEPSRRALSPAAAAFFAILEAETRRLNQVWGPGEAKR